MLVIEVDLLLGTYRGTGPDDLALTGQPVEGEWPPSPARLYAALVAGGATGDRTAPGCDVDALAVLEHEPPVIRADAPGDCVFTPLVSRFVVKNESSEGAVQNYPGRTAVPVRPGGRVVPRHPFVAFVWPQVTADPATLQALRARAARVGYLGCADSPVRLRVSDTLSPRLEGLAGWEPVAGGRDGAIAIPVPYPGFRNVLDRMFDAFSKGEPVRRSWYPSRQQWYRPPVEQREPQPAARPAIWLVLDRPVSPRHTVALTSALRSAVLQKYEELAGSAAAVPAVLHGHGGEPAGHAQFLALPHVGFSYADGRHRGLAISFPPGTDDRIVRTARLAAASVRRLYGPRFDVGISPHDGSRRPIAAAPWRWRGPSRRWASVLPVVHERYTRRRDPSLEEITQWCSYAGLPAPVKVRTTTAPFVPRSPNVPTLFTTRPGSDPRPYSHVELEFPEPVAGPVALGRMRHFGLGLLLPLDGGGANG